MKVLVTGAAGHLGFNLVAALVSEGHTVRGSLRCLSNSAVARVKSAGATDVVAAPLDSGPALQAAMGGMDALVHTAAIYLLHAPGRDAEIVRASVDGVEAALRAAQAARIERIVLTSSIATLPMTPAGSPAVDENAWTSDLRVPYFRAKTLAERRAWELARELKLDLVTVLPGPFGGPGFVRNTPSIDVIEAIVRGAMRVAAPPVSFPYLDVRDVARAHVLALGGRASGRFIAIDEPVPTLAEIAHLMKAIDRRVPAPLMTLPAFTTPMLPWLEGLVSWIEGTPRTLTPEMAATMNGRSYNITSARIRRELGWQPQITLRQSLADTMAAIRSRAGRRAAV